MGDYTLIKYLETVSVKISTAMDCVLRFSLQIALTTTDRTEFQTAIDNTQFSGAIELTFEGLKVSLEQSPCYNYIMVFTDEEGNDSGDTDLKNEIITLRDEKASCIFFVVIEKGYNFQWEQKFGDIGTVIFFC